MPLKEKYHNDLPHFQQPGQAYFVSWNLKNAIPPKALKRYTDKLSYLKQQIASAEKSANTQLVLLLKSDFYKTRKMYMKAYDDLLHLSKHSTIDLSKVSHSKIIRESLLFYENKRLHNYAYCIMPNHVHWAFKTLEVDENNKPVYLEKLMQAVKGFTSREINKLENKSGQLWQKESFDVTIRNEKHLYNVIEYIKYNPVSAGLTTRWNDWSGTWVDEDSNRGL